MKVILLCFVVVLAVCLVNADINDSQYAHFLGKYKKGYSKEEALRRYDIFKQNIKLIEEHNSNKDNTFQLGITEFADMTTEEFIATKLSSNAVAREVGDLELDLTLAPPASLDWRQNTNPQIVGPVRDQGQCGTANVFSIIDAISSEYSVKSQQDFYEFDPAYVYQCDGQGCNGGPIDTVWSFITKYGLNWYYNGCPTGPGLGLCINGKNCSTAGNENALKIAVAVLGPVSITIDASHSSFQLYTSGIYYEPACSTSNLDHNLLLVGYGTTNGQDYWIARNSWGASWGQKGDILLARNKNNNCGVASQACGAANVHTCVCEN